MALILCLPLFILDAIKFDSFIQPRPNSHITRLAFFVTEQHSGKRHFTCIDDPYEPPLKPELTLRTHKLEIEESAGGWRWTAYSRVRRSSTRPDCRIPAAMFDETVLAYSEYIQFECSSLRPITLFEHILLQCIQIEYLTICRFIYLNIFNFNSFYLSHLK